MYKKMYHANSTILPRFFEILPPIGNKEELLQQELLGTLMYEICYKDVEKDSSHLGWGKKVEAGRTILIRIQKSFIELH